MSAAERLAGRTFHGRRGDVANAFRYRVDYVLVEPEAPAPRLTLFSRNAPNLVSLHDADHGGPPGAGRGALWVREKLAAAGLSAATAGRLLLLAQPRVLGHVFNPVSFWLAHAPDGTLRAVIAEVTNTMGDRHAYLCAHPDARPITPGETLTAAKLLHVSPFQPVAGAYRFRFDVRADRIGIFIDYARPQGLYATLTGRRLPLTDAGVLATCLARPFGSRRVLALIHWQALRLWWKGAPFRRRPAPPARDLSAGTNLHTGA